MFQNKIRVLGLSAICLTVLLTGCASKPKIYINQNPSADFGQYRTFGFQDQLGTDGEQYSSLASGYLIAATVREMTARGYTESADPDLIVNFSIKGEEKIRTTQTPTSGGYYGYRGYGAWGGYGGYETRVTQYTEGTVNLDLVDASKQQLVWEGVIVGKVTDEVRENLQQVCDEVVTELLSSYPYVAGNSTPQPLGK
jgi:hypothetical protein